ncbi:c-type cytochrome [Thermomonas sp. HDW16]|uniref:c-type cytochrome n=1 Tax=Thermomonas sp. HDW16 TaxID=2714945 RepID=UPI00140B0814|nr:c-type cytochrome [Thermomonas sp. HDW16]QIL20578.1 c-type cytochrome [Thermomonas sp. HDW16]
MTKTSMTLLALACALALSACSKQEEHATEGAGHEAEAAHASSSAGLPAGHIEAGKTLASTKGATGQACVDCHGADGNAPIDATYPKLGGQYGDYLAHSLQAYRSGARGGSPTTDLMASQAKELTDQQIADLGAYFGSVNGQLKDMHGAN